MENFKKAEYAATKGIHMSPTFQGVISCMQIKIFSSVMLECASSLDGILCFIPIHCLLPITRKNIENIISNGLSTVMKMAETTKWNGKRTISVKTQNMIDPFLASLYNTYSLAASLTDPYQDCSLPAPKEVNFTLDVTYISEGENDNCKLEVLLHKSQEVVLFIWKEFKRYGTYVFLRHNKTTWKLNATNGNVFQINYSIKENKMITKSGELEKSVGWPKERMDVQQLIEEAKQKMHCKIKCLSSDTYKWIKNLPIQYLHGMKIDLDESFENGVTLLHSLAQIDETKNLKCVLEKIRNIDPCDSLGRTPLHLACLNSNFKTAKILIEHGANVNAITFDMESPLTILASQKEKDMKLLKMMLNLNAKREHENKNQMRAVDFVQQSKCKKEIIKLLQPQ